MENVKDIDGNSYKTVLLIKYNIVNKEKNIIYLALFFLTSFTIAQPTIDLIEPAFGGIGSTITI
ncbi:uncharacterized protein METZ01_LOCUS358809, partial [marine metagenome]